MTLRHEYLTLVTPSERACNGVNVEINTFQPFHAKQWCSVHNCCTNYIERERYALEHPLILAPASIGGLVQSHYLVSNEEEIH